MNLFEPFSFFDVSDFAEAHLIIHSFPLETVSVYEHFLKPNKIIPSKISAIPLTEVALEMIGANFGIMSMPKWALKSFKLPEKLIYKKIGKNSKAVECFEKTLELSSEDMLGATLQLATLGKRKIPDKTPENFMQGFYKKKFKYWSFNKCRNWW